jgi:hypothetical protein
MKHLHTFENFLNEGEYNHPYEVRHKVGDEINLPVVGPCKVVEVNVKPAKKYSNPWTSVSKDFNKFEPNRSFHKTTHDPKNIGNKAIKLETMDSFKDEVLLYQYEIGGKVYSQYAYMT